MRTHKSLQNARINTLYLLVNLLLSFFTRRIFLDYLGVGFIGLTTTLYSLLSLINITELGVGAAIGYRLYKPLLKGDREAVGRMISILGYIYSRIGYAILILSVAVSCLFPWIFKEGDFGLGIIYYAFYCYLLSSLIGYFVNYPAAIFTADQRSYEITRFTQGAQIIKLLMAVGVARYSGNLYIYVTLDLILALCTAWIIKWRLTRLYPWLEGSPKQGRKWLSGDPSIITQTKQIFAHKLSGVGREQLTPLMIYSFSSLDSVALYANYTLITSKLSAMVDAAMGGSWASVGNLIAEGDRAKIERVYFEMLSLRLIIAGYVTFMLYIFIEPLVVVWLGDGYLLSHRVLVVMLVAIYVGFQRNATDQFIAGYGLYGDLWAPYVQIGVYVIVAAICGYFWGLVGVLLGGAVSLICVVGIWKPYFLFKFGLQSGVGKYWAVVSRHLAAGGVAWGVGYYLNSNFSASEYTGFISLILNAVWLTIVICVIYLPMAYFFDRGTRDFVARVWRIVTKKGAAE